MYSKMITNSTTVHIIINKCTIVLRKQLLTVKRYTKMTTRMTEFLNETYPSPGLLYEDLLGPGEPGPGDGAGVVPGVRLEAAGDAED